MAFSQRYCPGSQPTAESAGRCIITSLKVLFSHVQSALQIFISVLSGTSTIVKKGCYVLDLPQHAHRQRS